MRIEDVSDRWPLPELTPPCLVHRAADEPSVEHVELRLTHRSFEAEQQTIIEMARVVDSVFVQDETAGQGADLEQAMPVDIAAGKARHL